MNIIYIGESSENSTSKHRANALKRLGNEVEVLNPYIIIKNRNKFLSIFYYKSGYQFIQNAILKFLKTSTEKIQKHKPNLIWVDSGELLGKKNLIYLKQFNCPILLLNIDDPTGNRDGYRFKSLLKAFKLYDIITVVRNESKLEFEKLGASNVKLITRSYDENAHHALQNISEITPEFQSDIAFIGTWMQYEKRDEFLLGLRKEGLNVAIWGDRWQKSPYWNELKEFYRGGGISGEHYVAAIQGSKICLGLLSKGNRDLHTQRSLEIPYAGGLLCAERTTEHLALYEEGEEAVFWSDVDECALICKQLLADDALRERIRLNGMKRVRLNKVGNEDICREVLAEVEKIRENR